MPLAPNNRTTDFQSVEQEGKIMSNGIDELQEALLSMAGEAEGTGDKKQGDKYRQAAKQCNLPTVINSYKPDEVPGVSIHLYNLVFITALCAAATD